MNIKSAATKTLECLPESIVASRNEHGDTASHAKWMLLEIAEGRVQGGKAGRWLGWAQAAVCFCCHSTLEKMKAINNEAAVSLFNVEHHDVDCGVGLGQGCTCNGEQHQEFTERQQQLRWVSESEALPNVAQDVLYIRKRQYQEFWDVRVVSLLINHEGVVPVPVQLGQKFPTDYYWKSGEINSGPILVTGAGYWADMSKLPLPESAFHESDRGFDYIVSKDVLKQNNFLGRCVHCLDNALRDGRCGSRHPDCLERKVREGNES